MVTTVALDLLLNLLVGQVLATGLPRPPSPGTTARGLPVVVGFGLLVLLPVEAWFLWSHPDWSASYVVSLSDRLALAMPLVMAADLASLVAGYVLGARTDAGGQRRLAALTAGGLLAVLALTFRPLLVLGTRAQYLAGTGEASWQDPGLLAGLMVAGLILAGAIALARASIARSAVAAG